jgi:hypothetical protein
MCKWISAVLAGSLLVFFTASGFAQGVLINELVSSNTDGIIDHEGDSPDWLELFNPGPGPVNLAGFGLSDNPDEPFRWVFPSCALDAGEHLLVFASGKDLRDPPLTWNTVIDWGDHWRYLIPDAGTPVQWRQPEFNDGAWPEGPSGFGFGDNDDNTVLPSTLSVFLRCSFQVDDPSQVRSAVLHIDYDDAFVAYLNGTEIARGNIGTAGVPPVYNQPADNANHEAQMYQGGHPESFAVDAIPSLLRAGSNVLAIQVHNQSLGSSDLTAIPFFTLGYAVYPGQATVSPYLDLPVQSLHTNFSIKSEGETVSLSDPDGKLVDSIATGVIPVNISLGRRADGDAGWVLFSQPTPGSPNSGPSYLPYRGGKIRFSPGGGYFDQAVTVELSSDNPGDSIYYTTDGSEPGPGSMLYRQPVAIGASKTLRARILRKYEYPGQVQNQTYLFGRRHDLPVLSLSTAPGNLWDLDTGIYVMGRNANQNFPHYGANFWKDWERAAHIQMWEGGGEPVIDLDIGFKIFGGWSRGHPQKSLSLYSRKRYGEEYFQHLIFAEKPVSEFKSLVLRNSGNDFNNTMFRDGLLTTITAPLGVDHQGFRPAVLYINGEYWGIQNIREKINEHFVAANHRVDPGKVDLLEGSGSVVTGERQHYTEMISFISSNSLAADTNYLWVKNRMDVENYARYLIAQIFIDNTDWPGNNIKFWRERSEQGKWRWIIYDTDFGFGPWDVNRYAGNTLSFALEANGPSWPNPPWSTLLFRKLVQNAEWRQYFINTFADHLNTSLLPQVVIAQIDRMAATINGEMPYHLQRWSGNLDSWYRRVNELKTFAQNRPGYVRQHILQQFGIARTREVRLDVNNPTAGKIRINSIHPPSYPWSGTYFEGVPVRLTAQPEPGYRFVRWEGGSNSTQDSISLPMTSGYQLVAVFEEDETFEGAVVINEINYNSGKSADSGDWIELYNDSGQEVDLSAWEIRDDDDAHRFELPSGTRLGAGEYLVICRNLEGFKVRFPEVLNSIGDLNYGLSSDSDCVRLFDNSGMLIDSVCYTSAAPWPAEPNGGGPSLALGNPASDNAQAANWYASYPHGTPGRANDRITGLGEGIADADFSSYPNPFSGATTIRFRLQAPDAVRLGIYDVSGREVVSLVNGRLPSGYHEVVFDHRAAGAGILIARLSTSQGVLTRKLLFQP